MDNQRLIIWGFFAIMAYLTWQTWMQDYGPRPQPAETDAGTLPAPVADLLPPDAGDDTDALPGLAMDEGDLPSDEASETTAESSAAPDADVSVIKVITDVLELDISTQGGAITLARVLRYPVAKDQPETKIRLLDTSRDNYGKIRSWLLSTDVDVVVPDANTVYQAPAPRYELGDDDTLVVPLRWSGPDGIDYEKRFVFTRGSYAILLEHSVNNRTDRPWRGGQVTQLLRRSFPKERSMFDVDSYSFDGPLIYNGSKAEKLDRDDLNDDGPVDYSTDDGWYASIQHHFLTAIVPEPPARNNFKVRVKNDLLTASVVSAPLSIEPGANGVFQRTLFVGPKLQAQLEEIHPKLKLSVDYGFLTILSNPLFAILAWVHKYVGNWGWAIIIVTILIKLAFYKLTEASGRSMAKMREIQPRMKALQDRYKDDRQALSQAMMELYKREKINPAAGCLPILIQMPFFLAFYWVLVESVEMRQAPFALWITDLSTRDPYFILPLIMGAAMLVQQKLNPAPADPVQAKVMQIMPIMFTVFFAFFPSGLVLYWVTNTLLSIAQQWKINKVVHAEATARKASKSGKKKKPPKDE